VETAGFNDKTWLDFAGHPHSEDLRVTERFRRTDFGHMQLDMTFDDPKTYLKSWSIHPSVSFVADDDLIENVCLENEKDRGRLVGKVEDERKAGKKVAVGVLSQYAGTYDVGPLGQWTVSVVGVQVEVVDLGQVAQPVGVDVHQRRATRQRRVHPGDHEGR
jgi:hypothetical protein